MTDEVAAFFDLNLASNWDEFSSAVEKFWIPGQNMIYADLEGNIGWRPAVALPIRTPGTGLVPLPGDDPRWDWQVFVPFDEMPYQLNPEQGYIATANNKTIGNEFPYYISAYWEPPARARSRAARCSGPWCFYPWFSPRSWAESPSCFPSSGGTWA